MDIKQKLIERVEDELTAVDVEARFSAMLDEVYSFKDVGGPFEYMTPSRVLEEVDPTAFRCGCADWSDGQDLEEVNGQQYEASEVQNIRDEIEAEDEDDDEE